MSNPFVVLCWCCPPDPIYLFPPDQARADAICKWPDCLNGHRPNPSPTAADHTERNDER